MLAAWLAKRSEHRVKDSPSPLSVPQGQFNNNKKSMWIREKEVSPLCGQGNCRRKKMRPSSQIYQEEWEKNLRNIPDSDCGLVAQPFYSAVKRACARPSPGPAQVGDAGHKVLPGLGGKTLKGGGSFKEKEKKTDCSGPRRKERRARVKMEVSVTQESSHFTVCSLGPLEDPSSLLPPPG